jgi:hypothetical protein
MRISILDFAHTETQSRLLNDKSIDYTPKTQKTQDDVVAQNS